MLYLYFYLNKGLNTSSTESKMFSESGFSQVSGHNVNVPTVIDPRSRVTYLLLDMFKAYTGLPTVEMRRRT